MATVLENKKDVADKSKHVIANILFSRENGVQKLKIKVDKRIEKLFSDPNTEISKVYKNTNGEGIAYYSIGNRLQKLEEKYNLSFRQGREILIREFGTDFIKGGRHNLSILRSVGISNGVEVVVDSLIMDSEIQEWSNTLSYYLKFLFLYFIENKKVIININAQY